MKKIPLLLTLLLLAAGYTTPGLADDASAGSRAIAPDARERLIDPRSEGTEGRQNGVAYRITGQENAIFSITFTYSPERKTDPNAVIVTALTVTGGGEVHTPTVIARHTILSRHTGITQQFKRTDPDTDINIVMDIEGRQGVALRVTNDQPMDKTPVGTIVHSILPWEKYVELMDDREDYHAKESRWAPCDGRGIADSKLAKLWGKDKAPDLRGVFLRGLNRFDPEEGKWTGVVDKKQKDPGEKIDDKLVARTEAGGFQGHNVGWHKHQFQGHGAHPHEGRKDAEDGGDIKNVWFGGDLGQVGHRDTVTNPPGETRPKNVAVYYYVKIN
uniref:Phage Tail Collar Domain n=1 Tax=Candidatus Kentrum eta TaxID=2126337 RepID=A0A450UJN4_9GAMM|nr:MAG: hypothetical protein BECKH772A_GA0070896_1001612 [Candidatus Kentron sp. H]VFJ92751.1 MAG: hypothetical protein BECKH772B_GA0070898_100337 [Candidatus Kentron sp. H]VFJ97598.1 MAG: hypothetical protein BECKH772C_GA0070978_1001411 [Candidatus Kentron sp. H]